MNLDALAPVLIEISRTAPFRGRLVSVAGKVGRVFWHGRDRYSHAFRYGESAHLHMLDCAGRSGFRIGVETEGGKIFACASNAIVCVEQA